MPLPRLFTGRSQPLPPTPSRSPERRQPTHAATPAAEKTWAQRLVDRCFPGARIAPGYAEIMDASTVVHVGRITTPLASRDPNPSGATTSPERITPTRKVASDLRALAARQRQVEEILEAATNAYNEPVDAPTLLELRLALSRDLDTNAELTPEEQASKATELKADALAFIQSFGPSKPVPRPIEQAITAAREAGNPEAVENALRPLIEGFISKDSLSPAQVHDMRTILLPAFSRRLYEAATSPHRREVSSISLASRLETEVGVYVASRYQTDAPEKSERQAAPAPSRSPARKAPEQARLELKLSLCLEQRNRIAASPTDDFLRRQNASTLRSVVETVEREQKLTLSSTSRDLTSDLLRRLVATAGTDKQSWTTMENLADRLRDLVLIAHAIDVDATRLRAEEDEVVHPVSADEPIVRRLVERSLRLGATRTRETRDLSVSSSGITANSRTVEDELRRIVRNCAVAIREHERSGRSDLRRLSSSTSEAANLGLTTVLIGIAQAATTIRIRRQQEEAAVQPDEVEKLITFAELNVTSSREHPQRLSEEVRSALTDVIAAKHQQFNLTTNAATKKALATEMELTAHAAIQLEKAVRLRGAIEGPDTSGRLTRLVDEAACQLRLPLTQVVPSHVIAGLDAKVTSIAAQRGIQARAIVRMAADLANPDTWTAPRAPHS